MADENLINSMFPIPESLMFPEDRTTMSSETFNAVSSEMAILRSNLDSDRLTPRDQLFKESKDTLRYGKDPALQELSERYNTESQAALHFSMEDYLTKTTGSVDEIQSTMEGTQQSIENLEAEKDSKLGFYTGVVLSTNPKLTRDQVEHQAFTMYAGSKLAEMFDEAGFAEWSTSIAGLIFQPTKTWNISEVIDSGLFETPQEMTRFVNNFNTLSPEEKAIEFDRLFEQSKDVMDENILNVANFMSMLMGTEGAAGHVKLEASFDALDITTYGLSGLTLGAAKNLMKFVKLNKKIDNLKEQQKTAEVIADSARSEDAMAAANMTGEEVAASVSPFKLEHIVPGATDNVSAEVVINLEQGVDSISRPLSELRELMDTGAKSSFLEREFLTEADQAAAVKAALNEVEELGEAYYTKFGLGIDNIQITDRTTEGVILEYNIAGIPTKRKVIFTTDDEVGTFSTKELDIVTPKLLSPGRLFINDDFLVNTATRLTDQSAKINEKLNQIYHKAVEPLGYAPTLRSGSLDKIDQVMLKGDDFTETNGKVFTPHELMYEGVETAQGTMRLTQKETQVYYNLRHMLDNLHDYENFMVRRRLQIKGLKEVHIRATRDIAGTMKDPLGKNVDSVYFTKQAAKQYLARSLNKDVKNLTPDELVKVTEATASNGRAGWRVSVPQDIVLKRELAKPYITVDKAKTAMKGQRNIRVWDGAANEGRGQMVVMRSSKELDELYADGVQLVRFNEKTKIGKAHTDFALIRDPAHVKELPNQVLNRRVGYVPKIYKPGMYYVRKSVKDGTSRLERIFATKTDADSYRNLQQTSSKDTYTVLHDRALSETEMDSQAMASFGGLYTGSRTSRRIPFGFNEDLPERLGAFQAIQKNINHISNSMPVNEWRMAMQKRWMNSVHAEFAERGLTVPKNFTFNSTLGSLPKTDKRRIALEELRTYISDQLRIPTTSERVFEASVRHMAEWMEGTVLDRAFKLPLAKGEVNIRKSVLNLGHKDPFSMMRSAAFHPLLGWFNASQLIVQAQGAALAMSMHPALAAKSLHQMLPLRAIMHLNHSSKEVGKAIEYTAKAAGMKPQELAELFEQFNKSGMSDGIKMTADLNATVQGYGIGYNGIRRMADKGLVFYREGELFTRQYSFVISRAEWLAKNPGKKINDAALKGIIDNAYRMSLNMSRANRAWWQKGIASVPTQFTQVYWKFVENMLPKKAGGSNVWTPKEKMMVLGGQLAVFGTVGVPAATYITNGIANLAGMDPGAMPDETATAIKYGVSGTLLELIGADVNVATRMAFMGDQNNIFSDLFIKDQPLREALFGAFGAIAGRSVDAVKAITPLLAAPFSNQGNYNLVNVASGMDSVLDIASSWRNFSAAATMYRIQKLYDKRGNLIIDREDEGGFSMGELAGKALGFPLKDVQKIYERGGELLTRRASTKELAEGMIKLHRDYFNSVVLDHTDIDKAAIGLYAQQDLLINLSGLSPMEVEKANELYIRKLTTSESKEAITVRRYIEMLGEAEGRSRSIGPQLEPITEVE